MQEKLELKALCESDAGVVSGLEQVIFGDAWSEKVVKDTILDAVRSEEAHVKGEEIAGYDYGAFGVFLDNVLAGYLFCVCVAEEGELHRVAVSPEFRRRGLAELLMDRMFTWLGERGCTASTLEVRAGNVPAVSLYEKYGYVTEGVRKKYYHHPDEDALIMWERRPEI